MSRKRFLSKSETLHALGASARVRDERDFKMTKREASSIQTRINCIQHNFEVACRFDDPMFLENVAAFAEEVRVRIEKLLAKQQKR